MALRGKTWPTDTEARALAIQGEFGRIVNMVVARGIKPTPQAKLLRLMGALIPGELTCVLNYKAHRNASVLLLGQQDERAVCNHVKMRARLRAVLGQEKDLAEHVRRSTFCWRLHELHDNLTSESATSPGKGASDVIGSQSSGNASNPTEPAAKMLEIWPFAKQFMGNFAFRAFGGAYRAVIQAALPGLSRDDLVGVLQASGDFENIAAPSLRLLIIRIKGLGFLEERDGLLYPTAQGEELLGSGEFTVLIERFIERIFGFPQLLKQIAEQPGQTDEQMVHALQALYPNWTTARMPNDLRNWTLYLDLVERDAHGGLILTDYGKGWVERLPKDLPKPPADETIASGFTTSSSEAPSIPYPTFDAILARFKADPEIAEFVFDERQLATLHAAWRSHPRKRFVLLSGLSGTGKTAVTLCYSKAVCELMSLSVSEHREVVPVSPDWRDPSGLLGYFNALHADPTFQAEPALRLVLRAVADPGRPYFLILDEMNLARVERYFAPFLSAMETGK
ncbi:MAG TPA: ATP-binding protein, partial [Polyangium sp.]|nr:ATP-binding protein [Polyangium sp.]